MDTSLARYRLLAVSAAAVAGIASLAVLAGRKAPAHSRGIIPSPRTTLLPRLTAEQAENLPCPPNVLPGARDVSTAHGSMRVYEWGPAAGRKVLLVHGIATPSPLFKDIAEALVGKGCRVMLFDLWGRGYSDTPAGMQHDSRLYTLQIHYAINSSPIAWTGEQSGRFSLLGFSLGGAIVLDFFGHHPSMVESLVLLAPVGLLRNLPAAYKSFWFDHPYLASTATIRRLVAKALGANATRKGDSVDSGTRQAFSPASAVQFQFDHHPGHVQSFLSALQYGPAQRQEAIWRKAGDIIGGVTAVAPAEKWPLHGGKILVVCGASDLVVPADDVQADLVKYMGGPAHFDFKTVPGNHGFPWTEGKNVGAVVASFWGL